MVLNYLFLDISDYMQDFRAPVECLYSRIVQIQGNLDEVKQVMTSWAQAPLFVRKDGKKDTTLCIDEREERTKKRYTEMRQVAARIQEYIFFHHIIDQNSFHRTTWKSIF